MIHKYFLRKSVLLCLLPLVLLVACQRESYPTFDRNELLESCVQGIVSGQTPVANRQSKEKNIRDADKLCNFRLNEFMKKVPYSDYKRYNLNIYENFERAYRQKYILRDIYDTLSSNDKIVFRNISKIMLGLDADHEK